MERLPVAFALMASLALAGCAVFQAEEEDEGEEQGTETSVALEGVPAAVRRAAEAAVPGMTVVKASKETDEGRLYFEVSGTVGGEPVDVMTTPEGEVVTVERGIHVDAVPEAVRAAALKRVPGLVPSKAEKILEKGAVSYELRGKAGGKVYEVKVSESGEVLEVED